MASPERRGNSIFPHSRSLPAFSVALSVFLILAVWNGCGCEVVSHCGFKLVRTDPTLDLSQKAEKRYTAVLTCISLLKNAVLCVCLFLICLSFVKDLLKSVADVFAKIITTIIFLIAYVSHRIRSWHSFYQVSGYMSLHLKSGWSLATAWADVVGWKCCQMTRKARFQKSICFTWLGGNALSRNPAIMQFENLICKGPHVNRNQQPTWTCIMQVCCFGNGYFSPIWTALANPKWNRDKLSALSFTRIVDLWAEYMTVVVWSHIAMGWFATKH